LHVLASDSTASFAVASNQDHVGYGHLSHEMAHRLLCDALEAATGRHVDARAVRLCPHRLEDPCGCRKPAPGLLLDLLEYFSVAPHEAVFVGDQPTDASAAEQAGIRFRWAHEVFGA
jgi:D-glycero-D-manno-heptose 1,7-bisphosphate phosphatase